MPPSTKSSISPSKFLSILAANTLDSRTVITQERPSSSDSSTSRTFTITIDDYDDVEDGNGSTDEYDGDDGNNESEDSKSTSSNEESKGGTASDDEPADMENLLHSLTPPSGKGGSASNVIKTLYRKLKYKANRLDTLTSKFQVILTSVKDFQKAQSSLFQKYNDLKSDYRDLEESMIRVLWVDMFGKEGYEACGRGASSDNRGTIQYDFLALTAPDKDLFENEERVGDRELGELLGEGQFATVHSCHNPKRPKERSLAVKIIKKHKIKTFESLKRLDNEVDVLRELAKDQHPGVLKLIEVLHGTRCLYMFTERLDLDLFDFYDDHPNGVSENLGRLIVQGIIEAVAFIHDKQIAHRDLKPENILLRRHWTEGSGAECEYDVVVCDFGLCARVESDGNGGYIPLTNFSGSPGFFAPEMFVAGSYDGFKADVWSIGCILLELLVGHDTFQECWMTAYDDEYMKSKRRFRNEIESGVAELKELRLPSKLSNFLQLLLNDVDGLTRPSVATLLKDDWLDDGEKALEDAAGKSTYRRQRLNSMHSPILQRAADSSTRKFENDESFQEGSFDD
jgi:serine/threonine protein kinase